MAAHHTSTNPRRDRHEARRILAQLRGRDLTGSVTTCDLDFFDRQQRLSANDNRKDIVAVVASREHH